MTRMGRISKSAKMKLTTRPRLMPPFHRTPARGTLPIEQTKLKIATTSDSLVRLGSGGLEQPGLAEEVEQHGEDDDHQRSADELRGGELPAHQQDQDDAELHHPIRGGDP